MIAGTAPRRKATVASHSSGRALHLLPHARAAPGGPIRTTPLFVLVLSAVAGGLLLLHACGDPTTPTVLLQGSAPDDHRRHSRRRDVRSDAHRREPGRGGHHEGHIDPARLGHPRLRPDPTARSPRLHARDWGPFDYGSRERSDGSTWPLHALPGERKRRALRRADHAGPLSAGPVGVDFPRLRTTN